MARMYHYYRDPKNDLDVWDFMNVSAVVGPGGVNQPDDIIVVQALLRYLPADLRGVSDRDCPLITGAFDSPTRDAIEMYQRSYNLRPNRKGRIIEDGRVSPAENRTLFGGGDYTWTIIRLNRDARKIGKLRGLNADVGYMDAIWERWPEVRAALHLSA